MIAKILILNSKHTHKYNKTPKNAKEIYEDEKYFNKN